MPIECVGVFGQATDEGNRVDVVYQQCWAVMHLHVTKLRNSITNYICNL